MTQNQRDKLYAPCLQRWEAEQKAQGIPVLLPLCLPPGAPPLTLEEYLDVELEREGG